MNTSRVGEVAAALMEGLADTYEEIDAEIGEVLILAEIKLPSTEEDPEGRTTFAFRCSDVRQWVQRAMMREGIDGEMHYGLGPTDDDDDNA